MPHDQHLPEFPLEEICLSYLQELRQKWDGRRRWINRRYPRPDAPRPKRANPPTLSLWMMSCPPRASDRAATLARLEATDCAGLRAQVQLDPNTEDDIPDRIVRQGLRVLHHFLDGTEDYLLLLEDDIEFNRHLLHNLHRWPPLRQRLVTLAGLFNAGMRELAFDLPQHAVVIDPQAIIGCQALLLSRSTAAYVVRNWDRYPTPLDLRLARLASELNRPLYYHSPSLVQHVGTTSTWGGRFYQAADYDPTWKSPGPKRPCAVAPMTTPTLLGAGMVKGV